MSGEDELVAWLRRRSSTGLIGDDAAVLPESQPWAVTMDTQIEGVHFVSGLDPALVARRLLAVNLSDLAAMGANPAYGFLALAAPPMFDHRCFFRALLRAAKACGMELAGGDLARSPTLTAVLTLLGRRGERWLERGGASPGETLWVGGTLGESAAGAALVGAGARLEAGRVRLPESFSATRKVRAAARRAVVRHLEPQPQLELGGWLAGTPASGAAMDISDGLARDLHRLCRESSVGAEIELGKLPGAPQAADLARALGRDFRDLALAGGEDYILLFTLPEGVEPPGRFECRAIGRIVRGRGVKGIDGNHEQEILPLGWDHLGQG